MGRNPHGIFGIASVDLMHAFESGLVILLLEVLINPLPDAIKNHLDEIAEKIFLSHHS